MKVNKKIFLGMGTIASVVSPVVAVISCGDEETTANNNGVKNNPKLNAEKIASKNDIDHELSAISHKSDAAIIAIVNKAKADIDNSKDNAEISKVKDKCIEDIKSKDRELNAQELATARGNANTAIDNALNAIHHKENASIKSLVTKAKDDIAKAAKEEIDNIKSTCITNIQNKDKELTGVEVAAALATARRNAITAINQAKGNLVHANDAIITSLVNAGISNINHAAKDAIEGIKNNLINRLQLKDRELTTAEFNKMKVNAKTEINILLSVLKHKSNSAITNLVEAGKHSIDNAKNEQEISTAKNACLGAMRQKDTELEKADKAALANAIAQAKQAINDFIDHATAATNLGFLSVPILWGIDNAKNLDEVREHREQGLQTLQRKENEAAEAKAVEFRKTALAAINAEKAKLTHKEDTLITEIITQVTTSINALKSEQEINRVKDQAIEALKEKDQFITYREEVRTKLTTDYITPAAELSKAITAWNSTADLSGINMNAIVQGLNRSLDAAHDRINVQNVITNANNLILVPYQNLIKEVIEKTCRKYAPQIRPFILAVGFSPNTMLLMNVNNIWSGPFKAAINETKTLTQLLTVLNTHKDKFINKIKDTTKAELNKLDNNVESIQQLITSWNTKVDQATTISAITDILKEGKKAIQAALTAPTILDLDESALQGLVSATGEINKEAAATAHVAIQMKDSLPTTGSADVTFTVTPMDGFSLGDTPAEFDVNITIPAVHISSNEETGSSQPIAEPGIDEQQKPQLAHHE